MDPVSYRTLTAVAFVNFDGFDGTDGGTTGELKFD